MSSCVHYKFTNSKDYDTIPFEGLHISLNDFRDAVIAQKKLGKSPDFILEVFNAQTKEDYRGDSTLIPRNASVLVKRVPVVRPSKAGSVLAVATGLSVEKPSKTTTTAKAGAPAKDLLKTADLVNADATEEEKVMAMMRQAGEDHDPSKYMNLPSRGRGRAPVDPNMPLPQNYVCYRCHERGHHIRNCPHPNIRRWTGVPKQFLVPAKPNAPGAMVDYDGQAVVPKIDQDAIQKGKKLTVADIPGADHLPEAPAPLVRVRVVPHELRCPLCKELLKDAALIPCCGKSYCDECIRDYLINHDFLCPSCGEKTLTDSLIPNVNLRHTAARFPLVDAPAPGDSAEPSANTAARSTDSPTPVPDSAATNSKSSNGEATPDRGTPSAGTPSGSGSLSPKKGGHSGDESESEEEEKKAKIKKSLEKAAEKVLSAMPTSYLPSSRSTHGLFGPAPVLGVDSMLNSHRSSSPAVGAPLSELQFYQMQRKMRSQTKRSRSRSRSPSRSRLRSCSRSRSRSRSPLYDRYRDYHHHRPLDYHYRRHRSRSPRYRHSTPPMSRREYEYWLERHHPRHHRSDEEQQKSSKKKHKKHHKHGKKHKKHKHKKHRHTEEAEEA